MKVLAEEGTNQMIEEIKKLKDNTTSAAKSRSFYDELYELLVQASNPETADYFCLGSLVDIEYTACPGLSIYDIINQIFNLTDFKPASAFGSTLNSDEKAYLINWSKYVLDTKFDHIRASNITMAYVADRDIYQKYPVIFNLLILGCIQSQ